MSRWPQIEKRLDQILAKSQDADVLRAVNWVQTELRHDIERAEALGPKSLFAKDAEEMAIAEFDAFISHWETQAERPARSPARTPT